MALPAEGGGVAVAGGGEGEQQPQQQQKSIGQTITGIIRVAVFWYFMSRFFFSSSKPTTSSEPGIQISNLFQKGELLDMWFYMSEHENFQDFANEKSLVWQETNIPYAVWGPGSTRSLSLKWYPSEDLKHNGSLYAHVYFARSGYSPDPNDPEYDPLAAFGRTYPVVTYMPKSKFDKRRSLLGNSKENGDVETVSEVEAASELESKDVPVEWASYWRPNITINLVDDFTRYTLNAIPPNIAPYLNIEATTSNYFPTIYFNEFWLLKDKLIPINETVTELPLNLEVGPISMTKWQLFLQIDQSFQIHRSYGSMLDGESDELKRVFLEGNPYLLIVTMFVSILHSLFDFLAFKNDIQFWNKNKSMEGLSAKSVVVNFICQLIVFLYLLFLFYFFYKFDYYSFCICRYTLNAVPPNIAPYLNIEATTSNYFPTIYFNEFWLLKDKLIPINETVTELPLNLEVGPISVTKWQLLLQIDQSFQIHRSYGSMLDGESDELKRVFLEGNPYLLIVTMFVSILHSLFDFLAFKNDIQFWNKNKSMEGLSAKSVVVNFICQLIVFLYLLDNDTSWMILASSGVGVCIEFWKIGKAMHVEIDRSRTIPMLKFRDRDSYKNNKTKEYDDIAMKYLSYLLFFLVVCSSIYSLMYERHRSWYSWILSSMTQCVYMFGFIMMCPQLFINYKLKSVAHMPWRQMTYKFLNTIIDDLFAFVIKMPWLHRLSVFRDDVIFLIYMYQRWIYPVDRKRVNEFGFGGEEEDKATEAIEAKEDDDKKTN